MAPASTTMTSSTSVELAPASMPVQKKIVLKSCYGRTGHKLRLEPCRDLRTNAWLGVEKLSEEQKRLRAYIVEPGVAFVEIRDGHEFDLTNEKDRLDWAWVQHCPQIATSRDATSYKIGGDEAEDFTSFEGADLEFYVHDEEQEAVLQEKRYTLEFQALEYIHEQSPSQMQQTARLLGSNMQSTRLTDLRNFLNSKARKHPEQVLKVKSDPYSKQRLFLFGALDKQIIRKSGGVYYYNDTPLGTTEEQVMLWLQEDRNYVLVRAMSLELYPTLAPKPQVSEANLEIFNQTASISSQPQAPITAPDFTTQHTGATGSGADLDFEDEDPDAVLGTQHNDASTDAADTDTTAADSASAARTATLPRSAARRQQNRPS